jgi:hypothetical protein
MPDLLRVFRRGRKRRAAFVLALALLLGLPAAASADDSTNLALCKQILSRMLCKKINEFSYVGRVEEGVYVISMFYASKSSEMLCAVMPDGQVIIQDRTWRAMRRVVPYTMDSEGKCMSASYSSPDCPVRKAIKVCPPKTAQDVKEQNRETFWNRPIPKILEEEYKAMSARGQQNATDAPAPAQAPAEGGAQ